MLRANRRKKKMSESPDVKKNSANQSSSPAPPPPPQEEANQPIAVVKEGTSQVGAPSQGAKPAASAQATERAGGIVAQPRTASGPKEGWMVILVEDNPTTREEVKDYFEGKLFDNRPLSFQE